MKSLYHKENTALRTILSKLSLLLIFLSIENCFAVGLGNIHLYSGLNEPLNAEIELHGIENMSLANLAADLASNNDFVRSGMSKPFFLSKIKFDVIVMPDGRGVIHLHSKESVKHPFIDLLVQLT